MSAFNRAATTSATALSLPSWASTFASTFKEINKASAGTVGEVVCYSFCTPPPATVWPLVRSFLFFVFRLMAIGEWFFSLVSLFALFARKTPKSSSCVNSCMKYCIDSSLCSYIPALAVIFVNYFPYIILFRYSEFRFLLVNIVDLSLDQYHLKQGCWSLICLCAMEVVHGPKQSHWRF